MRKIYTAIIKLSEFIENDYIDSDASASITEKARAISKKPIEKISPKDISDIITQINLYNDRGYIWCHCAIWNIFCCDSDYFGALDACSIDARKPYLQTFQDVADNEIILQVTPGDLVVTAD